MIAPPNMTSLIPSVVHLCFLVFCTIPVRCVLRAPEIPIYWNVPTETCQRFGVDFRQLSQFGLIQNSGDQFRGDKLVILYDPGEFPAYIDGEARNGGLPQEGDLDRHLEAFQKQVELSVPHRDFSGIGILDFEKWRPIWRENWGSLDDYRVKSREVERRKHPFWPPAEIEKRAVRRFEKAAYAFIEETLALAIKLRPGGRWGFYGYPYCYNFTPKNPSTQCSYKVQEDNERSRWMYETGTALYPSIYMSELELSEAKHVKMIEGRIQEATRIRARAPSRGLLVLPYLWIKYHDTRNLLSRADLKGGIDTSVKMGSDGLIIWGSTNDTNSYKQCQLLYDYVVKVVQPILEDHPQNLNLIF